MTARAAARRTMNTDSSPYDTIVIGGGIAGLTAASYLGRSGQRTLLLERSSKLGGRAVTREVEGFHFNVGPHALYLAAAGAKILDDLGVAFPGGSPGGSGSWILVGEQPHRMPVSAPEILTTPLLSWRERAEVLRAMIRLSAYARDPEWQHRPLRKWLETKLPSPRSRQFIEMFIRLATYSGDVGQNAGAALQQLAIALQGVRYLDHGWQTLVNGLAACVSQQGVTIETSAGVSKVISDGSRVSVHLADGRVCEAATVVLASGPKFAAHAVNEGAVPSLTRWAESVRPVSAACLDVGLSGLPNADANFALAMDRPCYYSVHTQCAQLAPAGGAVIHVARYLGENDPVDIEAELESILDLFQPGWRELVVSKRYLPRMAVTEAAVPADHPRPGPAIPELPNLFVAGDWVGTEGMLVDASFASARLAAELANTRLKEASLANA